MPAEKRRAAIKLKRELSDQIAWSAETIRQIISGRHVVANALAEAGRVDPFLAQVLGLALVTFTKRGEPHHAYHSKRVILLLNFRA